MSRPSPYPDYDVRKIIHAFRHPRSDLLNIVAHRGLRCVPDAIENSCSAVASAATAGWEAVEIDIRHTRDCRVLVWHDEGLGRVSSIQPPEGEEVYNPFTGVGFNPLVQDMRWADIQKLFLRDAMGNVTSQKPVLLDELLEFIRGEGINIVLQLDVKTMECLAPTYEIISKYANSSGINAMEWCIWKCHIEWFETPDELEQQNWVQHALSSGKGFVYTPFYEMVREGSLGRMVDTMALWAAKPYCLCWEVAHAYPGGQFQAVMDHIHSGESGLEGFGTWYVGGDLPAKYYSGELKSIYDDSSVRDEIIAAGRGRPTFLSENCGAILAHGLLANTRGSSRKDDRTDLTYHAKGGFTYLVADPFEDLGERLTELNQRNVDRMMKDRS